MGCGDTTQSVRLCLIEKVLLIAYTFGYQVNRGIAKSHSHDYIVRINRLVEKIKSAKLNLNPVILFYILYFPIELVIKDITLKPIFHQAFVGRIGVNKATDVVFN